MTPAITARRLLTDIGSIEFPVITIGADGTLADISSDPRALANETGTLTAAFLDIHTHGALGHDVMTASPAALQQMQRFLAAHGVAHFLPTTVTAPIDDTLGSLEAFADAIESGAPGPDFRTRDTQLGAQPIGIHLEGPFLSHARRGVHPPADLQPPSIALFDRFQSAARGHIRLLTIAPEPGAPGPASGTRVATGPQDSALDLIRHATSLGVRVSLGHSNATAQEAVAAIAAGATSATHTFNAMRALEQREPGILGVALTDDRLFAELICDGIHVAPALVSLWLRAKTNARAILVTDAMSAAGMPDGDYALGRLGVTVADGRALLKDDLAAGKHTLAGSVLTMDRALENLQAFTGASLADATRLASHNPAAMLGLPELTRLAPGSVANLNRFDQRGRLVATYIRGKLIPGP